MTSFISAQKRLTVLQAHGAQGDKAGIEYAEHLFYVASRVPERLADVAVAHDVLEDTDTTPGELARVGYNAQELAILDSLTRRKRESYTDYIERLSKNDDAVIIKLADLHHNLQPERLEHLDESTQNRLRAKYQHALEILYGLSFDSTRD